MTHKLSSDGAAVVAPDAKYLPVDENTLEAVNEVLNSGKMTPEQISAIKLAEIDFEKFLKTHEIKLEEVSSADRASARDLQKSAPSQMPAALTLLITMGFFSVLGWMLYDKGSMDNPPLLIMLGSLGTAWTAATSFWFGTTAGSRAKTDLLANSVQPK